MFVSTIFEVVSSVFQGCSKGVLGMFICLSWILKGSFEDDSRVHPGCFKGVSRMFVIFEFCFRGISRFFKECVKAVLRFSRSV